MALSLWGFNPKLSLYVASVVVILLVFLLFKLFPFVDRLTKTTVRLVVASILPGILVLVVGAKELIIGVARTVLLFNQKWIDKLSLRVHPAKNVLTDQRREEQTTKEFHQPENEEILQQTEQHQECDHQDNGDHHQQPNNEIFHIEQVIEDTDDGDHLQQPNNEILHIKHVIEDTDNGDHHQQPNNEILHIEQVIEDTDDGDHHQQPNNEILHIKHVIQDTDNGDYHQQPNNEILHIEHVIEDTDNGDHHQQPNNDSLLIEHVIEDTLEPESDKPDLEIETKGERGSQLLNYTAENLEPEMGNIQEIEEEEEEKVDCKKFESLTQDFETQEENFDAQLQDPTDENELEKESVGDEVFRRVSECTCPQKITVWKEQGKYKFCNDRVSRMVVFHDGTASFRKGGGWQTIDEYLERKDPCRDSHRHHRTSSQVTKPDSRRSSTSSLSSEQIRLSSDLGPGTEPGPEHNGTSISGRGQWERSQSIGEIDTRWTTRDFPAGARPWRAQSSGIPVLNRNEAISARLRRASSVTGDNGSSPIKRRTSEPSSRQSLRFQRSASVANSKDIFQCPPWRF